MVLQFQAPFQINPNAESPELRQLRTLGDTFSNIGTGIENFKTARDNQNYKQALLDLQKSKDLRERSQFKADYGFDPNDPSSTPPPQFGASQPSTGGSSQPMGYEDFGSQQSVPLPDSASIDHSAHFNNWKSMGMPSTYDHPDYGGAGTIAKPTMDPYRDLQTYLDSNPTLGSKQRLAATELALKKSEIVKNMNASGGTKDAYTPDQVRALVPGAKAEQLIKSYNGASIPKDAVHQLMGVNRTDISLGERNDQYNQKRLTALGDAIDPSKQKAGAFGVSKQVFDRAERLESLASAFKDGNLDSRQVEEMAIGLNAMLSGANTGAQAQVAALVPKTILGDAQKLKEWILSKPQGAEQQAFVQRMLGSVAREKATAADQIKRTQFQRIARYGDLEKSTPDEFYNTIQSGGVDPEEYKSWKKGGYKPISAVQGADGGGSGGYLHTAVNPQTKQRIGTKDGVNWEPIQ